MTEEDFLLNIHTTGETALVSLSRGDKVLHTEFNHEFKEHAAFLHLAIERLLKENRLTPVAFKAISVTHGPGSYTGIRVGMAAAKGICYALKIPLITLSTLDVMAASAIHKLKDPLGLYCPMIDARRMEVYTAMYDFNQARLSEPQAVIIDSSFYKSFMHTNQVYFFGSGSTKLVKILGEEKQLRYQFQEIDIEPAALALMSYKKFLNHEFSDLAYSEPEYLKEFNSTTN